MRVFSVQKDVFRRQGCYRKHCKLQIIFHFNHEDSFINHDGGNYIMIEGVKQGEVHEHYTQMLFILFFFQLSLI
jgi:hypothetical protein